MKRFKIVSLLFLISCGNSTSEPKSEFKHLLPDTSKTWAGQMTRAAFHQTRKLEEKLNIKSLTNGIQGEELRVWGISGYYDPQSLTIISNIEEKGWTLRQVDFYNIYNDSISSDVTKPIATFAFDDYWHLASQSDLKNGDGYSCMDGGDIFIEMSNAKNYRYMWFRCPDINEKKDSAFYKVMELRKKIAGLIGE